MRPGPLSPRPQIDHIRKPQILAAAAEVIGERGLASTRIADVAERAGTSPPAVLYWFGSKDDLLTDALTFDEDRFYGAVTERLAGLERPRDRLRVLIEACAAEYDCRLWIELWGRALRDQGAAVARQRLDDRWRDQIAEVIRAGQQLGEFAGADGDDVAAIIASLLDGLAVQATLGDPGIPPERMRELAVSTAELLLGCELPALDREALAVAPARRSDVTPGDLWTRRLDDAPSRAAPGRRRPGAGRPALAGCGIGRGIQGDVNRRIEPKVDGDLFYFNYSQYINPALVKEFEKRYDVRVIESYFDSMEGMLAKLRAGNAYDVMFPTAEYVQRLIQQEQLLRIPRDKLENLDNIYGYFDDPWYDPDSAHSVPYALYITGIGYRADILDNMTGSWDDLGNEEAAGRIYVLDDYQEALAAGNLRNGYDMNTVVESELDATKDWLVGLKPLLRGFSVDTITNMSSGNAWIQHLWNGDIVNIRYRVDDPEAYQFEKITQDGFPVGSDAMVIPVNAEHPGTALLFIDFMLDPKNAAQNVSWNGYPMPNHGQDETFDELAKGDPNIVVTVDDLEGGEQFANLPQEDRELWTNTFLEVKAS